MPIRDARLTELCAIVSRSGLQRTGIYRADDPEWRRLRPPRHYNCRCGLVPLSVEDAAARGIREAKRWLADGFLAQPPAWVPHVPVELPPGWAPAAGLAAVI